MPYPTIQDSQGLPDPAAGFNWTMDIMLNGNILINHLYVLEVTFPFTYIDSVSRYRAGSFLYFPGHSNIDSVTVSFYETEDFRVLSAFRKWQSYVIDDDGNYGLPDRYLGQAILTNYDGRGRPQATCNLNGCWPARLQDWNLSYHNSDHLQVSVQLSVNSSEFNFANVSAGTAQAISQMPSNRGGALAYQFLV